LLKVALNTKNQSINLNVWPCHMGWSISPKCMILSREKIDQYIWNIQN
jgi:hypothetical protein